MTPNPCPNLKEFVIKQHPKNGGIQTIYRFPNGYGASVVEHSFSYGLELAVIKFTSLDNDDFDLSYETPVTADVLGFLDQDSLQKTLKQIKSLSAELVLN